MRRIAVGLIVVAFLLSACGGDSSESLTEVPDVKGKRLDVAKSDLTIAGIAEEKVEVVGGGALGVIDESGWTACDQDPAAGERTDSVRLLVDRECGPEDSFEAGGASPVAESSRPATTPASSLITVPNQVGNDLQAAQDGMQAAGLYVLQSQDLSGQERNQVLDRNWKVCSQDPPAGSRVPEDTTITFGVVRDEESCP